MIEKTLRQLVPLKKRKIIKCCMPYLGLIIIFWCAATYFILPYVLDSVTEVGYQRKLFLGWFFVLALLVVWKTAYPILYFITYFYDITDRDIIIRKGVLTQREITLPFSKITDVNVDQDVWDVIFGLYDVHISTPTADSGLFAHIDGVNRTGAEQIKKMILNNMYLKDDSEEIQENGLGRIEGIEKKALPEVD